MLMVFSTPSEDIYNMQLEEGRLRASLSTSIESYSIMLLASISLYRETLLSGGWYEQVQRLVFVD